MFQEILGLVNNFEGRSCRWIVLFTLEEWSFNNNRLHVAESGDVELKSRLAWGWPA